MQLIYARTWSYTSFLVRHHCTNTPKWLILQQSRPALSPLSLYSRRIKSETSKQHYSTPTSTSDAHLNPHPSSYSVTPFTDRCTIRTSAGSGGHGCVSFLREKYIPNGPPNGGDGGSGGNIYIQAVRGETSLHRTARQGIFRAGRGKNGQGRGRGGERGHDVIITVPVGTIVREVERFDPVEREPYMGYDPQRPPTEDEVRQRREKLIVYPGAMERRDFFAVDDLPILPQRRTSTLAALHPPAPIRLDLDTPMDTPMLLAAGAVGGLGNTHFISRDMMRPKYATKGEEGIRLTLALELKMLADVGLVGLPNAGKSTLLRALSNSRTRVGSWAFTTLQPSIGTVVLDNHIGRPRIRAQGPDGTPRHNFTIADIPGLIEDAHLDKGLGLGFLRHVERASVLAFVVDLSGNVDAVETLCTLWREVGAYETMQEAAVNAEHESRSGLQMLVEMTEGQPQPDMVAVPIPISAKPWIIVATKADLEGTESQYERLLAFVEDVKSGKVPHPSGRKNAWRENVQVVPVSAIRGEGVERLPELLANLLE